MKKYRLFPAICLAAALLLSACSQDELTENSTTLPEGEYPLQIGSVTLTAEVSEQPHGLPKLPSIGRTNNLPP